MRRHYQWLPLFEARLRNYLHLKYEDLVDNRLTMIEDYLGFPLSGDAEGDDAHDHVPRTRGYCNWMDWFTEEGRDFLRPIFNDYMVTYGYDNAWNLSVDPTISSEHSIDYVIRTVNKRRAVPFVIS
jgi:hypothetical protein